MKITIITAVLNNREFIEECISSVLNQTHKAIEYIIIDGGSTDGTVAVIKRYENNISKWMSGPDSGVYHALNKGLQLASGDIIGFLHSDDFYANDKVIETVASQMKNHNIDSCYSDLLYVSRNNMENIIRYWKSSPYKQGLFRRGWMPPHPTFFVKREVYKKYGLFNTDFKIAADYELMLRFLERYRISTHYIPEVLIKMRVGGVSNRSLKNLFMKSCEDYKAWKVNNLGGGLTTIFLKNICKIPQFFPDRG
jgi:glycosyltransferase